MEMCTILRFACNWTHFPLYISWSCPGKTTLLVSIICRYLLEQPSSERKRRLLVCAPTNKAVTVLATRFMAAMNPEKCRYNALMVGDAEKLLAEELGSNNSSSNNKQKQQLETLKSIFVFSWLESMVESYKRVLSNVRNSLSSIEKYKFARQLQRRLESNLNMGSSERLRLNAKKITQALKAKSLGDDYDDEEFDPKQSSAASTATSTNTPFNLTKVGREMLSDLSSLNINDISRHLISNADVIFCTLASAGGIMLHDHRVDDLIVDEAAAATEPLIYIPFHMKPSRLVSCFACVEKRDHAIVCLS